jgi:hypothetical protein
MLHYSYSALGAGAVGPFERELAARGEGDAYADADRATGQAAEVDRARALDPADLVPVDRDTDGLDVDAAGSVDTDDEFAAA